MSFDFFMILSHKCFKLVLSNFKMMKVLKELMQTAQGVLYTNYYCNLNPLDLAPRSIQDLKINFKIDGLFKIHRLICHLFWRKIEGQLLFMTQIIFI